jgi:hypothetical protein
MSKGVYQFFAISALLVVFGFSIYGIYQISLFLEFMNKSKAKYGEEIYNQTNQTFQIVEALFVFRLILYLYFLLSSAFGVRGVWKMKWLGATIALFTVWTVWFLVSIILARILAGSLVSGFAILIAFIVVGIIGLVSTVNLFRYNKHMKQEATVINNSNPYDYGQPQTAYNTSPYSVSGNQPAYNI